MKNIVITGANGGIGFQTAKALYLDGNNVIFGSRDQIKNKIAQNQIKSLATSSNVAIIKSFKLDLSSKKSVIQFAENVKKQFHSLDILINNAGIMAYPDKNLSIQGIQLQLAINHLGHFHLTSLLFDLLKKAKSAKIINVSSDVHKQLKMFDVNDLNCELTQYSPMKQYNVTKVANIIFTNALAEFCSQSYPNISAYSLHPGVVKTGLSQKSIAMIKCFICCCGCCLKKPSQGAETTLFLARTQRTYLKNGGYYKDSQLSQVNQITKDRKAWRDLWAKSENLLQIKFTI